MPTKGRPPYVDPRSERFDKLPQKVQASSLCRAHEDICLEREVVNRIPDVNHVSTLQKYQIFLELRQLYPNLAKARLFAACGIAPSREKELELAITSPDQYAEVKAAMIDIYKKCNGKVGRIVMAKYLRKYGYYICDITARRLMKELGLVYYDGKHTSK